MDHRTDVQHKGEPPKSCWACSSFTSPKTRHIFTSQPDVAHACIVAVVVTCLKGTWHRRRAPQRACAKQGPARPAASARRERCDLGIPAVHHTPAQPSCGWSLKFRPCSPDRHPGGPGGLPDIQCACACCEPSPRWHCAHARACGRTGCTDWRRHAAGKHHQTSFTTKPRMCFIPCMQRLACAPSCTVCAHACHDTILSCLCRPQATLIEIFGTAAVDAASSILLGVPQFRAFITAVATNPSIVTLLNNIGTLADATGQLEVGVLVKP